MFSDIANLTSQKRDFRNKLIVFRDTNINSENSFKDERFLKKLENNITKQKNYIDVKN